MHLPRHTQAELALLSMTIIWGVSFPIVKIVLGNLPPALFLLLRFSLALIVIIPLIRRNNFADFRNTLLPGTILGLFLSLGYLFQTIGIVYTSATKNAFITALYVVFVPLLYIIIHRRRPGTPALAGAAISLSGLYLLTSPDGGLLNSGDVLTLAAAFLYAFYIIYVEIYSLTCKIGPLVFWQILCSIPIFGIYAFTFEHHHTVFNEISIGTIIVMATLGTALPVFIQTGLQKYTTPSRAAVIYSGEAVFAAVASNMLLGENLSITGWIGACGILSGILICELGKPRTYSG